MPAPSVRRRLTLSFLGILGLFAINEGISIWSDQTRARSFAALDQALHRSILIGSIRQQLSDLYKEVTLLGEVHFEPGAASDSSAQHDFEAKLAKIAQDIAAVRKTSTPTGSADAAALESGFSELAGLWKQFYEYLGVEPGWSVAFLARADHLGQRLLKTVVPRLEADGNRAAAGARAEFEDLTGRTHAVTLVIFIVSIVVAVLVASRISTYLVRRLTALRQGADRIGEAHLQHRISVEPHDELGELAQHFNAMAVNLGAAQSELYRANEELAGLNRILSQRIEEELARVRLAARIQRDLFPKAPPVIPGYDLAGRSIPAQTVGGDYFDYLLKDEQRVALCLGDVSGKGLPASLLMANLQAAIRSQVLAGASVAECLRRTNMLLHRSTDAKTFVTAFYCELDLESHELKFSNAGHNPPLLFSGRRTDRLDRGGVVLGIFPEFEFDEGTCRLEQGDVLVIYSDGISEAWNSAKDEFGEGGIIAVVGRERERNADQVMEAILRAAMDFSGEQPQSDDMTLMVLKRQ